MIPSECALADTSFAVPEEIYVLANVEVSVPQIEQMPKRATISRPEFTDYIIGLVQGFDHCAENSEYANAWPVKFVARVNGRECGLT
jgi:hypothetical protein